MNTYWAVRGWASRRCWDWRKEVNWRPVSAEASDCQEWDCAGILRLLRHQRRRRLLVVVVAVAAAAAADVVVVVVERRCCWKIERTIVVVVVVVVVAAAAAWIYFVNIFAFFCHVFSGT